MEENKLNQAETTEGESAQQEPNDESTQPNPPAEIELPYSVNVAGFENN